MSDLRIETLVRPGADLGPDNPLSPLGLGRDLHGVDNASAGILEEMLRNSAYGRVSNVLPYTMQDGYNRVRSPRELRVAVLENERDPPRHLSAGTWWAPLVACPQTHGA